LLREFGRRAHLYLKDSSQIPDSGDTLEWISLMRHYGAPTRMLDWTYSIHVAAHFALSSSENNKPCWIWAIDPEKLNAQAEILHPGLKEPRGSVQKSGAYFRKYFMATPPNTFVSTSTPYRLNERLAIQRGVFLCPGNVTKSFLDNLNATGSIDAYAIEVSKDYGQSLRGLLLELNINCEVLFPGLQGLGQSLRDRLSQLYHLVEDGTIDISCIGRSSDV
jgi:FRG domain